VQLTIDSADPLEHVLKVVGSLYGTELTLASNSAASAAATAAKTPARGRKRNTSTRTAKDKRAAGRTAGASDVRAWARAQGQVISTRGPIAADVKRAYAAAHP
jgi:hypothetical protein